MRWTKLTWTGSEPNDGHPVVLSDWIRTDGLRCLKIKLRGDDLQWDYDRITRIGQLAVEAAGPVANNGLQLHGNGSGDT